ncbi:MAG: glutathione synthase [Xanthomonadales bacterium]|nr:glutathione synthase [Xanthomonadales bacterium]
MTDGEPVGDPLKIGVVMDPIQSINIKKDSTFAMLLEAQRRGHTLAYMEPGNLWVDQGDPWGHQRPLTVEDNPAGWFQLGDAVATPLAELDVILMRKDPPFDIEYVFDTYVLERAEQAGVLVVNRPAALRDINEKAYIAWFPDLTPQTLIARDRQVLKDFVHAQGDAVIKPLGGMGGESIFKVSSADSNLNVILETVSHDGRKLIMAQGYVQEITEGDKRVLIVNGEPIPYALARIPAADDFRGNLAKGGTGKAVPLSEADLAIASRVGPVLKEKGVLFAGIDVIGDRLTEINVTSPTCIRELDAAHDLNIAGQLFEVIEDIRRQ